MLADGIIQGVSTAEGVAFQGDEPITFNEAATVLNRVLAVEDVDLASWYADREAVPSWAAQAVGNMEAVSVLAAGSFGSAAMGETVTRADAAQMLSAAGTLLEGGTGRPLRLAPLSREFPAEQTALRKKRPCFSEGLAAF